MASGQFGRDKPSSRPKINPRDVVDLVSSTATSDSEYKKNGAMEDKKAPVAKTETEGALKRKSAAMSTAVGEDGKYKSIYAAEESKTKKAKLSDSDGKDESHDEDNHDHDRDSNSDNDGHNSDTESLFDEQFPILGDDALVGKFITATCIYSKLYLGLCANFD